MKRILRLFVIAILLAGHSYAFAQLRSSYPYICSDGKAYSVRTIPFPMAGINLSGVYQKFQAFCKSPSMSLTACEDDNTSETLRCYKEFRRKGNLTSIGGKVAIQPGQFRHMASVQWFARVAEANEALMRQTCRAAVVATNCARIRQSEGQQLKCMYERSSLAARSLGRNCYAALNLKFDALARQVSLAPPNRSVANND